MRNFSVAALGCLIFVGCGDSSSDSSNNPVSGSGAASASAPSCQASQTLICHVPPGDPASEQSICVGTSAVKAHLAHGDHVGACCTPTTCALQGDNCGTIADGCGGMIDCGTCGRDAVCTAGKCCTPLTACPAGDDCGTVADGCGGSISCGDCTPPAACGVARANQCGTCGEQLCNVDSDCLQYGCSFTICDPTNRVPVVVNGVQFVGVCTSN
jgi:hypothetical protein